MSEQTETTETFNPSAGRFNRSALKKHLLVVGANRVNKLTRVSAEALDQIEARAETKIRELMAAKVSTPLGGVITPQPGVNFLTGKGKQRLVEAFQNWLAAEMQRVVNDQRTGKTI